jgi:hypothetical protein
MFLIRLQLLVCSQHRLHLALLHYVKDANVRDRNMSECQKPQGATGLSEVTSKLQNECGNSPIYGIKGFYANTSVTEHKNGRSHQEEKYWCDRECAKKYQTLQFWFVH